MGVRVSEFAASAGVSPKTVRFYEERGLLRPDGRTPSGYRVYSPQQVERLRFIRAARMLGFSLRDISEMLAVWDRGRRPCDDVVRHVARKIREIDGQIQNLYHLKRQLEALHDAAQALSADEGNSTNTQERCICPLVASLASASKSEPVAMEQPPGRRSEPVKRRVP